MVFPGVRSKSYKLSKALYGLKQAHLAWHTKLCRDFKAYPSVKDVELFLGVQLKWDRDEQGRLRTLRLSQSYTLRVFYDV